MNSRKIYLIIAALLMTFLVFVYLVSKFESSVTGSSSDTYELSNVDNQEHEDTLNHEPGSSSNSMTSNLYKMRAKELDDSNGKYIKPFKISPTPEEYEKEEKHKGRLPNSIRKFSLYMADEITKAKRHKTYAVSLFDLLITCATASDKDEVVLVRSICAENAKTLGEIYPDELGQKYVESEKQFDEAVMRLMLD